MFINVNGEIHYVSFFFGINDNRPTNWTYELCKSVAKGKDKDNHFLIDEKDYKILQEIEEQIEIKKHYSFSLEYKHREEIEIEQLLKEMKEENDYFDEPTKELILLSRELIASVEDGRFEYDTGATDRLLWDIRRAINKIDI